MTVWQNPSVALKPLEKLIGEWEITGRTFDSRQNNISGKVKIRWFGHYFMIQLGEIKSVGFKVQSLELVGRNQSRTIAPFSSLVYSSMGETPLRYYWDVRDNIVKHWTKGAIYTGHFSRDHNTLSGAWRPIGNRKNTSANSYDAIMVRAK